jgi:hypothetical protein
LTAISPFKLSNFTGQHDPIQGHQTTDISWWPKPAAWEASGLYVGHWSQDCEMWFQKRLEDIKSGHADLRTSSKWKNSLKLWKTVASTNEKLAGQFLLQI